MLNRELQPGPLRLGRPDQSARARILNQPSTAMLAQANQGPADGLSEGETSPRSGKLDTTYGSAPLTRAQEFQRRREPHTTQR